MPREVLLTRPLEESQRIAGELEPEIPCLIWPLTRIVPLPAPPLPRVDAVLASSANGIRAFAAASPKRELPVFAVGARTASVARGLGFGIVVSAEGDATALANLAGASGMRRMLHPRGRETTGDLAGTLAQKGIQVAEAVLYAAEETGPPPAPVAHALSRGVGALTVWSPRHGAILARRLGEMAAPLSRSTLIAISANAAQPLAGLPFAKVEIAAKPNAAEMVRLIRALPD
ncbi:MAG: uroporphyrinogen-III synthase [Pseudomonadota bacterium]